MRVDGFELDASAGDEPRIRDVDLGARLGYDQPRDIRKLIKRMADTGEIADVITRATVARIKAKANSTRSVELEEYWLDEEQALLVCMRSDAPRDTVRKRLEKGWSVEKSLTTPTRAKAPNRTGARYRGSS